MKDRSIKWKPELAIEIYILAKNGACDQDINKALGIGFTRLDEWKKKHPEVVYALHRARAKPTQGGTNETFREYVYRHLPKDLQQLWDYLHMWYDNETHGLEKIEAAFKNRGIEVRQQMFVHCLVDTNFNASEACRMVGISRRTLEIWTHKDPNFLDLMNEIEWHKKNFFENSFVQLVVEGNPLAIIHANRTKNRDRGYGDKIEVTHQGSINLTAIPLNKLKLSLECLLEIEEASKAYEEERETLKLTNGQNPAKGQERAVTEVLATEA